MKHYQISFCIVCMNRLHHIQKTLLQNIKDNEAYSPTEFILLNYNSGDGLDEYIQAHFKKEIERKKLIYYKNPAPKYFHRSHSRNIAFRLAKGEIVCNLDADNYTGKGFSAYINEEFNRQENIFLSSSLHPDVTGRVIMRRGDFLSLGGYDEKMADYGFEDYDLISRMERKGLTNIHIKENKYLNAISHSKSERVANEFLRNQLEHCYLSQLTPSSSTVLFLLNNGNFIKANLINSNGINSSFIFKPFRNPMVTRENNELLEGEWIHTGKEINLYHKGILSDSLKESPSSIFPGMLKGGSIKYEKVKTSSALVDEIIQFFCEQTNKNKWILNNENNCLTVNPNGFGHASVYKNFNVNHSISLS
ncbi:glycosyltransferase family A protein [Mucilaginibacter sp.]|uniref:glycosyltransferase family A protein n=1 Tax=Mucilaginibacter sp. TaxID=1882438 RepID=UPI0025EEB97F|nr:glycosyltransferase family A protein [Mucilaginibacter sp.]